MNGRVRRAGQRRDPHQHPPFEPAGQRLAPHGPVPMLLEPERLDDVVRPVAGVPPRQAPQPPKEPEVMEDRQPPVEIRLLGHHTQHRLDRVRVRHGILSMDANAPGRGHELGSDLAHQRGLARAVRPQDGQELAGLHVERDVAVRPRPIPVPLAQPPKASSTGPPDVSVAIMLSP